MPTTDTLVRAALFSALLALAWLVYAPGLHGPFLFDDYANLPALGDYGTINNTERLISYLTSGIAGPTGRPLALLSFLIDDNKWPTSPEAFKYTSTLLHLLNGVLLIWLSTRLAQALGHTRKHAEWIGLLAGGLWLLHPFWVSTTLYIVQRMTLLCATFVLGGLLAYVHGRQRLLAGTRQRAYLWMSGGIVFGTTLAVLSKESGALLPLFALLIEWLVFSRAEEKTVRETPIYLSHRRRPMSSFLLFLGSGFGRNGKKAINQSCHSMSDSTFRWWRTIFLIAPTILLLAYLVHQTPGAITGAAHSRDFTLAQRLLTEPRIVLTYIKHLFLPEPYTAGLFQDSITVSTNLVRPWTTFPAMAVIAGLLFLGWKVRRRYPSLALAIFFFFAGHLIESTVVALELYFEHRSYTPALFIFLPLSIWIVTAAAPAPKLRIELAVMLLVVISSLTWLRADLWGNAAQQGLMWAQKNPDSPRAQTYAALILEQKGSYETAQGILNKASEKHPDSVMIELNRLSLACNINRVKQEEVMQAAEALRTDKRTERLAYQIINKFIQKLDRQPCTGLGTAQIERLILAALANPALARSDGSRQSMLNLYGLLALKTGHPETAAQRFIQALQVKPRPGAALTEAAQMGSAGHPCMGLAILAEYHAASTHQSARLGFSMVSLHRWWLQRSKYYSSEFDRISRLLRQDALKSGGSCAQASLATTRRAQ
ncbi:tetratricopeptide repeat protein [Nitrococcus mobilis]|uniref:Tetratricopeptide repeat protein n=1 Tax=Nitrococcus mobilis Nb-231 TaxID=314278 RepID=A4BNH5_9GAMM|nr:hypothetical protein [Nitrococcus mobilis]EAR22774.1 hypothetical protein NB231_09988 [Nitrococcus mobilis Nb-231]